jgi:hypothetical protein
MIEVCLGLEDWDLDFSGRKKLVTDLAHRRSSAVEEQRNVLTKTTKRKNMKRSLVALLGAGMMTASWFAIANAQDPAGSGGHGGWHRGNPLEHMTESLDLTADQKAKIQPIIDQATPQLKAIHQEAMQKAHAVMENAMSQIRPLLTPDQQKKADDMRQAHQDVRNAVKKLHDAKSN